MEADLCQVNLMSWLGRIQPGISGEHVSSGAFCASEARTLITPPLAEVCPEEFEATAQAQMIRRCAWRAGVVKYTGAFADAIWTRLLRCTARVLQRCAVTLVTNLPHEPATYMARTLTSDSTIMCEQRVVPPPRATRFQTNSPLNYVEDGSDDADEGEGEELTETEDEGDHWRVQARSSV